MTKLLITGATGTIGTNLIKHLESDYQLVLADIDFSDFPRRFKTRIYYY